MTEEEFSYLPEEICYNVFRKIDKQEDYILSIIGYLDVYGNPTPKFNGLFDTDEEVKEGEIDINIDKLIENIPKEYQNNNISYSIIEGYKTNSELQAHISIAVQELGFDKLKARMEYYYNNYNPPKKLKNFFSDKLYLEVMTDSTVNGTMKKTF